MKMRREKRKSRKMKEKREEKRKTRKERRKSEKVILVPRKAHTGMDTTPDHQQ